MSKQKQVQKKFFLIGAPVVKTNGIAMMGVMVEDENDGTTQLLKKAKIAVRIHDEGNILDMLYKWSIQKIIAVCEEISPDTYQIKKVTQLSLSAE